MAEEVASAPHISSTTRLRIGYALAPKKVQSFIQPFLNHAKQRGLDLIPVDLNTPLTEQGPFDCIIHKLSGPLWKRQLDDFSSQYPDVPIIDRLDAIERLHNRISMLQVVNELKVRHQDQPTFGIPKQIFVQQSVTESSLLDRINREDLKFPVIAKPLVSDGSANSHQMSLVFNEEGLKLLSSPIVLQEFVNHGGVIFKVYVAGNHVKCVKRKSLPDITGERLGRSENLLSFSQISNLTSEQGKSDDSVAKLIESAEMPPSSFVAEIASGLREALGLHLFNFDMIRDSRDANRYLVIDINYFPGYVKMPGYETLVTEFLLDVAHGKQRAVEEDIDK